MNIDQMRIIVDAYNRISEMDLLPHDLFMKLHKAFEEYLGETATEPSSVEMQIIRGEFPNYYTPGIGSSEVAFQLYMSRTGCSWDEAEKAFITKSNNEPIPCLLNEQEKQRALNLSDTNSAQKLYNDIAFRTDIGWEGGKKQVDAFLKTRNK